MWGLIRGGREQGQKEAVGETSTAGAARRERWAPGLVGPAESPFAATPIDPNPQSSSFSSPWASGWKCSKCDMRENLWLNLTDGSILCGRRYFDGSGGNNHAVEHYRETGYPLAVKLGTITPDGAGTCLPSPLNVSQLLISYDTNNISAFPDTKMKDFPRS